MTSDQDRTHTYIPSDDPVLEAGLAVAFGPESAERGWSQPPVLRDDPSDHSPLVRPDSPEMPKADHDRYQLLGEIARGGMGVILKGRDPRLGRDLAFKVLKVDLAGKPAAEQRFQEEAQVCGQLQHPGVVPVYDLGWFADGRPYFAMKFVKGHTLDELLTARPDPVAERGRFLQIYHQVCQTIAYAHARGVVHRDLKPANVMVGHFNEVLVMDWGLAKVLPRGGVADEERATQASRARQRPEEPTVIHTARSGSGSETVAGSVMGTPGFMSPEQAGGEIDKLDERADVFGLGAVLCVILTGNPPYVANTADAVRLMAVRGQLADAFGRLDGCGAGPDLIGLCKRCLSADRDSRPRHAGEVAGAMAAHLAGVEDRVRQAQVERAAAETRTAEERKRRRVQLALAVSLLTLVGVAGGALLLVQKQRSDRAQAEADLDRQELVARREAAVRAERSRVGVEQALAQLPELYRRGLWDHADATLEKTETFLGPDADPEVQARVARAKRDTLILRRLDQIRLRFGEQFDAAAAAREYAEALRDAGFGEFRMGPRELADRLREHPYSEHLLAAAAALLNHTPRPDERLYWDAVLDAVYPPNTFYGQWRRANRSPDPKEVLRLVERVEYDRLTPTTIWLMSLNLHFRQPPEAEAAARLLRAGLDYYPSDFWLHYELCTVSLRRMNPPRLDVAIRHGTAAVALRPRIARAHYELAYGLYRHGDLSRAEAECREAVHLDPGFVWSHFDLASVLRAKGDLDGALAAGREAVSVDPTNPSTYIGLGWTLEARGDRVGAVEAYRNAVRVGPKHAPAHDNLGIALRATGDWDGAIAAFRESARVDPKSKFPFVQLRQTEEWRSLAPQLDAVKSGQKVSNPNKMVQLATLAAQPSRREYALAFSLFHEAFTRLKPTDLLNVHRYDAACAAIQLAAGKDRTAVIGIDEWYYLQKMARQWLTAEMAPHRRLAWSGTARTRQMLADRYAHWQHDLELESVRDPGQRAAMPEEERKAWEQFWTEVEVVRKLAIMPLPDALAGYSP